MGQIRSDRPPDWSRISRNKSTLEKEDAMFIDFIGSIKADYSSPFLFRPSKIQPHKIEGGKLNLSVDDYDLEKIGYQISTPSDPTASDSSTTTFWKTKDHLYFLMIMGGLDGGPKLFGPFRLKGDTFVLGGKP